LQRFLHDGRADALEILCVAAADAVDAQLLHARVLQAHGQARFIPAQAAAHGHAPAHGRGAQQGADDHQS